MFERGVTHTIHMSVGEEYGHLFVKPPLSEKEYDIAIRALHLTRTYRDYEQSLTSDGEATEFKILVDSERHLNGRANRLFDGLSEAKINAELDESVTYA